MAILTATLLLAWSFSLLAWVPVWRWHGTAINPLKTLKRAAKMPDKETTSTQRMKIGELNGKWSVLFKFTLSGFAMVLPSLVALNVWFVSTIYTIKMTQATMGQQLQAFIDLGPRYTQTMADSDNLKLQQAILREVKESYPPEWLRREVESLARRVESLERQGN